MLVAKNDLVKTAMLFCGISGKYINGDTSDYEKLLSFLSAVPKMAGHKAVFDTDRLLSSFFDSEISVLSGVSLYGTQGFCDILWRGFNSVSVGETPPKELYSANGSSFTEPDIELLPIPDITLGVLSGNSPSLSSLAKKGTEPTSVISSVLKKNIKTVMLSLRNFCFDRNSRKKEIEAHIANSANGAVLSEKEENQLITALVTRLCKAVKASGITLFLDVISGDIPELTRLYDHLQLEKSVPKTVIISDKALRFRDFIEKFEYPSSENIPAIVIASDDAKSDKTWFPSGFIYRTE